MLKIVRYAAAALALVAVVSCENEDLNIGQTLTDNSDKLSLSIANYSVSTRTILADSVLSLSADCYFGRIKDPETGAQVTSEFTTQFHLLETTYLSPEDKVLSRLDGRAVADSCDIILYLDTPSNQDDSLVAMKMRVCEMAIPMEEGQRYYSNFSPVQAGMLRADGINKPMVFSYANLDETDSARTSSTYQPAIRITLNQPYTDVNGVTYKNYGTFLMRQYYDHPEFFRNSFVFTHTLCPGFFFQITDGLGFHSKVTNIGLRTYYTANSDSAVVHSQWVLAGTHEVLQTTHVKNDLEALRQMAAETEHTYLKTPAGLFTEVTLPVVNIKQGHEGDSLLSAKLVFQRLNNQNSDSRLLAIPQALLMVEKDSLYSFFEKGRKPDNITSYCTALNKSTLSNISNTSNDNTYTFNNLSSLVTTLWQNRMEGLRNDPNWEEHHPDWNKMVLVPISYSTSSSTASITNVHHDMSITSTRLVGGSDNPYDPIRISIVYAKFQ